MSDTLQSAPRTAPLSEDGLIDARGPKFTAAVTAAVLALALAALAAGRPTPAAALLSAQVAAFALGAWRLDRQPYARVWRRWIRPRLSAASTWESADAPRFAQGVGLGFTVVALAATLAAAIPLAVTAVTGALVAATINAVFGLCLGCRIYPIAVRVRRLMTVR